MHIRLTPFRKSPQNMRLTKGVQKGETLDVRLPIQMGTASVGGGGSYKMARILQMTEKITENSNNSKM